MRFNDFIEYCIGTEVNSGFTNQPPCWHFEYEHVSGSLYLHKAIVCLPLEMTNKVMIKITRDCYKLESKIIYQKIESYQYQISDSDLKKSANKIEIRVFEELLDEECEQDKIDKEKFSFKTGRLDV